MKVISNQLINIYDKPFSTLKSYKRIHSFEIFVNDIGFIQFVSKFTFLYMTFLLFVSHLKIVYISKYFSEGHFYLSCIQCSQ